MKTTFKHPKFTAVFADENGYFSLTGEVDGSTGAVGKKIAAIKPDFKPLEKLHLADCKTGAPMHAWANADYYAKNGDMQALQNHLRTDAKTASTYRALILSIGSTQKTIAELTPYRKHTCATPFKYFKEASIWDKEQADKRYNKCHHEWIEPVTFNDTQNLTGEKTPLCKCGRRPMVSSPWCDIKGVPFDDNKTNRAVTNLKALVTETENLKKELSQLQSFLLTQWQKEAKEVYELVNDMETNLCSSFIDPYDENGDFISEDYENHLDDMSEPKKAVATAMQEDLDVLDVEEQDTNVYSVAGREYFVLTDYEADKAWDEDLENYIDDCLEIPEGMENYFDREAWKRDARMDGRGHCIGRYDGIEYTQTVNNTTYFLYRQ